jgi:hypothetical protein
MKLLAIGIFLIILVGIAFFATQLIKYPQIFDIAQTTQTGSVEDLSKRFVEVQRGFTFPYHADLSLADIRMMSGYAPVLMQTYAPEAADPQAKGYVAVSTELLESFPSTDIEIDTYSESIPIKRTLEQLIGSPVDVRVGFAQKLTFPNSISGFIIDYSAVQGGQTLAEGKMYFYRVRQKLNYAFSVYLPGQGSQYQSGQQVDAPSKNTPENSADKQKKLFLQYADIGLKLMSIQ